MSSQLMSARPKCVIVPATMISGPGTSVAAHGGTVQADGDVRAVAPRSRIVGWLPGAPLGLISRAPATFPERAQRRDAGRLLQLRGVDVADGEGELLGLRRLRHAGHHDRVELHRVKLELEVLGLGPRSERDLLYPRLEADVARAERDGLPLRLVRYDGER